MAGENNETEGTEPKTFKQNFTDFAKNLGSSLNVFKQNVQNAIDGVNTIATKNKETFQKYWAREDDSEWGKGEVLSNIYQLTQPEVTYVVTTSSGLVATRDPIEFWNTSASHYNGSIDLADYLTIGNWYRFELLYGGASAGGDTRDANLNITINGTNVTFIRNYDTGNHTSNGFAIRPLYECELTDTTIKISSSSSAFSSSTRLKITLLDY